MIRELKQIDARTLGISWTDGRETRLDVVRLRQECPCASCVDEWSGQRKQGAVGDDVRPTTIQSVGRYALNIHFSDGHRTGYFTFDLLRRLSTSSS